MLLFLSFLLMFECTKGNLQHRQRKLLWSESDERQARVGTYLPFPPPLSAVHGALDPGPLRLPQHAQLLQPGGRSPQPRPQPPRRPALLPRRRPARIRRRRAAPSARSTLHPDVFIRFFSCADFGRVDALNFHWRKNATLSPSF